MSKTTFRYTINSVQLATSFKLEDSKVKKDEDDNYILTNDDDMNYYVLDCYTTSDTAGWYDLFWTINNEDSDVDEITKSYKFYKKCSSKQHNLHINSSSAFAMESCDWEVEEI